MKVYEGMTFPIRFHAQCAGGAVRVEWPRSVFWELIDHEYGFEFPRIMMGVNRDGSRLNFTIRPNRVGEKGKIVRIPMAMPFVWIDDSYAIDHFWKTARFHDIKTIATIQADPWSISCTGFGWYVSKDSKPETPCCCVSDRRQCYVHGYWPEFWDYESRASCQICRNERGAQ